jgi:hypothetical protein
MLISAAVPFRPSGLPAYCELLLFQPRCICGGTLLPNTKTPRWRPLGSSRVTTAEVHAVLTRSACVLFRGEKAENGQSLQFAGTQARAHVSSGEVSVQARFFISATRASRLQEQAGSDNGQLRLEMRRPRRVLSLLLLHPATRASRLQEHGNERNQTFRWSRGAPPRSLRASPHLPGRRSPELTCAPQARRGMHLLAFPGVWRQDALTSCYAGVRVQEKIQ